MSYTEHYKGTMTKLYKDMSLAEQVIAELRKYYNNINFFADLNGDFEEALELLREEDDYIIHGKYLYKIKYQELNPDSSIATATQITDDVLAFEVRYYNGGCDFYEALEAALEKL